jgi:hypothetical protein
MFMFGVDNVSAETPQIYFRPRAVERWGTRNIKKTEKRFAVTDWMKKTMVCICTNDSCMAEG